MSTPDGWPWAFLVLLLPFDTQAATYHVRQGGGGDCTTITACLGRLAPGDTLLVHAGTYNESFDGNIPSGTSESTRVTLKAAPGETVTIKGPQGHHTISCGTQVVQKFITIQGFKLVANGQNVIKTYGVVPGIPPPSGNPQDPWCSYLRVLENEITGAGSLGLGTTGDAIVSGGEHFELIRNNIHHNGWQDQDCSYGPGWNIVYVNGSNNLFDGNWVHDNIGNAMAFWTSANVRAFDNTARYNIVHNNSHKGRTCRPPLGGGISCAGQYQNSDRCIIHDNLVYNNDSGISIGANLRGGDGAKIFNNTLFGNKPSGGLSIDHQTNVLVQNNLLIDNEYTDGSGYPPQPVGDNDLWNLGSSGVFSHNLCSAPGLGTTCVTTTSAKFVNAAAGDFRLAAGSPAIGAGLNLYSSGFTTDITGAARPQTGAYDLGAYQSGATVPPPPPPSTPPSLSASKTSAAPGSSVTATVAYGPGSTTDWVGLYAPSAPHDLAGIIAWQYLNGTQVAPASALNSAVLTFAMPAQPGVYQLRLYANDGFTMIASAPNITVAAAASTDLNSDGRTDITDVQLAINDALGLTSCGSGDVNGDGSCNVSDVQKVVNAALGT